MTTVHATAVNAYHDYDEGWVIVSLRDETGDWYTYSMSADSADRLIALLDMLMQPPTDDDEDPP